MYLQYVTIGNETWTESCLDEPTIACIERLLECKQLYDFLLRTVQLKQGSTSLLIELQRNGHVEGGILGTGPDSHDPLVLASVLLSSVPLENSHLFTEFAESEPIMPEWLFKRWSRTGTMKEDEFWVALLKPTSESAFERLLKLSVADLKQAFTQKEVHSLSFSRVEQYLEFGRSNASESSSAY